MNMRLIGLAVLAVLLYACAPDPSEPTLARPATATELRLRDSLELLRADYDSLRLWEALDRARRLRVEMEALSDSVGAEVRVEVYQYLGMLYYHRAKYEDSIQLFTNRAEALIGSLSSPVLRARQYLCAAYTDYTEWEWLEMDMMATLGRRVLEEEHLTESHLYAELLVAQGYARRKYSETNMEGEAQRMAQASAEELYLRAMRIYQNLASPHFFKAQERLLDYYIKVPSKDSAIATVINSLAASTRARKVVPSMSDRLALFWHRQRERVDSAILYADRVLTSQKPFDQIYWREANFAMSNINRARGKFSSAIANLKADANELGCLPNYYVPDSGATYAQRYICPYYAINEADVLLDRYHTTGDTADLQRAFVLTQEAVRRYADTYPTTDESGTLNKVYELGVRLLDVALETALIVSHAQPSPDHLNNVLEVMELGKAFLLARDLSSAREWTEDEDLLSLRSEFASLKYRYQKNFDLNTLELVRFREIEGRVKKLAQTFSPPGPGGKGLSDQYASNAIVDEVQKGLRLDEAFLEMTDSRSGTLLLYIDKDTASLFLIDPTIAGQAELLTQRLSINGFKSPAEYYELAGSVYCGLLGPLEHLLAKRRTLLISPSNSLRHLSFSGLTSPTDRAVQHYADLNYLLDNYIVRYVPSWRVEKHFRSSRTNNWIASAKVGIWTHPSLIHYMGDLGTWIAEQPSFTAVHYPNPQSNASQFLLNSGSFDLLHYSVHAGSNSQRFQDNFIYLNNQDSISAAMLLRIPMQAKLVVLAACATARGFVHGGEGTFSLQRSFHLAGVPDVICSQYYIPAAATAKLLKQFYLHLLLSDKGIAAALTSAQRECRSGKLSPRYTNPYYWSGMIAG